MKLNLRQETKDKDWYIEIFEHYYPYVLTLNEHAKELDKLYKFRNNDISGFLEELQAACNSKLDPEEEILPFNKIPNKIEVLKGDLLKRNDNFTIVMLSWHAVKRKDEQLKEAIMQAVDSKLQKQIEVFMAQAQQLDEKQMQQIEQKYRDILMPEAIDKKSFKTEWELFYERALKFAAFNQNLKFKKLETLEDAIITDRFFIYNGWEHGQPVFKVLNPKRCAYHKAPDEFFVSKGDFFAYREPITMTEIYETYYDKLDKDSKDIVDQYVNGYLQHYKVDPKSYWPTDDRHLKLTKEIYNNSLLDPYKDNLRSGLHQDQTYSWSQTFLWKTHLEFKAYRKLGYLTYQDELGESITEMIDASFELPDNAIEEEYTNRFQEQSTRWHWVDELTQASFIYEEMWMPRRYEVTRIADNVYVDFREVPFQPINFENPYSSFELSYKGAVFSSRNAKSLSPMQRALPFQFQYFLVKRLQNKELRKYKGYVRKTNVDEIPQDLVKDINGDIIEGLDPLTQHELLIDQLGVDYFSASQGGFDPNRQSGANSGYVAGNANEIMFLQNLLQSIDVEIGMAMGISPQRESQMVESNVTDNQQAIMQSSLATESYFFYHSEVWKTVLNEYLYQFRQYCENIFSENPERKEHFLEYILPDGTKELFDITPDVLEHTDIGLFLTNTGQERVYKDLMLQSIHAFSQNAGEGMEEVSLMAQLITSDNSPQEIHRQLEVLSERKSKRAQEMQKMEQEHQEKLMAMQTESREDVQAHEIEKIVVKEVERRRTEIEKATIAALGWSEGEDEDARIIEQSKQSLAERKVNQDASFKQQELALKNKEIDTRKEIADNANKVALKNKVTGEK